MSHYISTPEATHERDAHATPADFGITKHSSSNSLRGTPDRRPGAIEPITAGVIGAVRDRDTATTAPEITVHGELSDDALEALAALLIGNYFHDQETKTPEPAAKPKLKRGELTQ